MMGFLGKVHPVVAGEVDHFNEYGFKV